MGSFAIEMTFEIKAPAKKVFDALTKEINKWWKPDYFVGGDQTKKIVCEPKLGGHMYEVWGTQEGTIWGTITEVQKNKRLEICGTIGLSGAAWCKVGYTLQSEGKNSTTIAFSHYAIGEFEDGIDEEYSTGWEDLFEAMKSYLEKKRK